MHYISYKHDFLLFMGPCAAWMLAEVQMCCNDLGSRCSSGCSFKQICQTLFNCTRGMKHCTFFVDLWLGSRIHHCRDDLVQPRHHGHIIATIPGSHRVVSAPKRSLDSLLCIDVGGIVAPAKGFNSTRNISPPKHAWFEENFIAWSFAGQRASRNSGAFATRFGATSLGSLWHQMKAPTLLSNWCSENCSKQQEE